MPGIASSLEMVLKKIISKTTPHGEMVKKYGGLLWHHPNSNKPYCGVFVYSSHTSVEFTQGYRLKDPVGLLTGSGKYRRHLKFPDESYLDEAYLAKLVRQAYNLAGTSG